MPDGAAVGAGLRVRRRYLLVLVRRTAARFSASSRGLRFGAGRSGPPFLGCVSF
jgi:hypothetical protein